MFARTPAHRQYATIGVESQVFGANDHRLISLLFDGAIEAIDRARTLRETGQAAESAVMTARARTIVTEGLRASLDRHRGGEIAVNLDSLYEFVLRRLVAAGVGDLRAFDEARSLLDQLRGTWSEIDPERHGAAVTAPRASRLVAAYG